MTDTFIHGAKPGRLNTVTESFHFGDSAGLGLTRAMVAAPAASVESIGIMSLITRDDTGTVLRAAHTLLDADECQRLAVSLLDMSAHLRRQSSVNRTGEKAAQSADIDIPMPRIRTTPPAVFRWPGMARALTLAAATAGTLNLIGCGGGSADLQAIPQQAAEHTRHVDGPAACGTAGLTDVFTTTPDATGTATVSVTYAINGLQFPMLAFAGAWSGTTVDSSSDVSMPASAATATYSITFSTPATAGKPLRLKLYACDGTSATTDINWRVTVTQSTDSHVTTPTTPSTTAAR